MYVSFLSLHVLHLRTSFIVMTYIDTSDILLLLIFNAVCAVLFCSCVYPTVLPPHVMLKGLRGILNKTMNKCVSKTCLLDVFRNFFYRTESFHCNFEYSVYML
uniref:Putative secreted protein n=1 Tax=Ixodes ricinus TaxID=34613 RepID=A0A6B0UIG8_IXORI